MGSDVLQLGREPQVWQKIMAAHRRVDGLKSAVGWLPVHRDQLRAQRLMGELYLFTFKRVSRGDQIGNILR